MVFDARIWPQIYIPNNIDLKIIDAIIALFL
jgi:hypothetical protein